MGTSKIYGRTCNICHERITRLSDLELDHTRAHSKGGVKQALAHKHCNRMKSNGSLGRIQKILGVKSKTKKRKKIVKKTSKPGNYYINPITGRMEKFNPMSI